MWTLISATPSPYARKVRVALAEKGLPFTLQTEVPWDSTSKTPKYNPLEKLPVLILDGSQPALYESHYIMDWLEIKYPETSLMPEILDDKLFAKKVEVIADGICDALVLAFFENKREQDKQSHPWRARQMRKADGGLQALAKWVDDAGNGEFMIGKSLTLADIATVSVLGWLSVRWPDHGWKEKHPRLNEYYQRLDARESFANTRPSPQNISDPVV